MHYRAAPTTRTKISLTTSMSAVQTLPVRCVAAWLTIDTSVAVTVRYDEDADKNDIVPAGAVWSLYPNGETEFPETAAISVQFAVASGTAKAVLHTRAQVV
jgi:hypothetical protein